MNHMAARAPVPRIALAAAAFASACIAGGLLHYGLSSDVPNPYSQTHLLIALTSTSVGMWVVMQRRDHPLGWILLFGAGLTAAWVYAAQPVFVELAWHGAPDWVLRHLSATVVGTWLITRGALFIAAPSVVPGGWPQGLRKGLLAGGAAATIVLTAAQIVIFYDQPFGGDGEQALDGVARSAADVGEWASKAQWVASASVIVTLLVVVLAGTATARRQQRWFLVGVVILAVPALVAGANAVFPDFSVHSALFDRTEQVASTLLPLMLLIAILRDQMLDIEVVIRRVAVYGLLTLLGGVVYVAVVTLASRAVNDSTAVAPVIATGAVALAFQPMRGISQRWVARHVFGDRDEPYRVLARLGRRLADAPGNEQALPALVGGIAEGLRLPWVSVELDLPGETEPVTVASAGRKQANVEAFPLTFAGDEIGRLVIAPRTERESFSTTERSLLRDLATHAGVVAHDALLAADLQRSKLDLVVAREEERRRLRGDLHDGLGPTLASVSLGLEAAAARIDDADLVGLLHDLNRDLREAMADIRRLVYGLRPPALDELGLTRALESFATGMSGIGQPAVSVRSGGLDSLPAAVEVAAYRIALEAINNVRRHAAASRCEVVLRQETGALVLSITDDGVGFGGNRAGVGVVSMRQRAGDLGGQLVIESPPGGGTSIVARLPLPRANTEVLSA